MPKTKHSPVKLLSDLGIDVMNLSSQEDYKSALIEGLAKLQYTGETSSERFALLRDEVRRVKKEQQKEINPAYTTKEERPEFTVKKSTITGAAFKRGSSVGGAQKVKADVTGASAIQKYKPGGQPGGSTEDISKSPVTASLENSVKAIAGTVNSIKDTLKERQELAKDQGAESQQELEKAKRAKAEKGLESKVFSGLKKAGEAIIAPVKGMWDTLMDFITTVFLGRVVMKFMDWFAKKENQKKIDSLFKFLKDWWPVLLSSIMAFLPGLLGPGGMILGVIALQAWGIPKIIDEVKSIFGFGKQVDGEIKTGEQNLKQSSESISKDVDKDSNKLIDDISKENDIEEPPPQKDPSQSENPKEINKLETQQPQQMNEGGPVQGEKGKDKIPAMLSDGEFVMSKKAVDEYGTEHLAGMNAAAGATNTPMMKEGVPGFNQGGQVGKQVGPPHPPLMTKQEGTKKGGGGILGGAAKGAAIGALFGPLGMVAGGIVGGAIAAFKKRGGGAEDKLAKDMIKLHEGLRLEKYMDTEGFPTIGYGHLIEPGEGIPDKITKQQADKLFEGDYRHHKLAAQKIPGYGSASSEQKAALIDLTFNMGPTWYKSFPKFTAAFAKGDYGQAGAELENSKWYGQVGVRAPKIVDLIKGGKGVSLPSKEKPPSSSQSSTKPAGSSTSTIAKKPPSSPNIQPPSRPSSSVVAYDQMSKMSSSEKVPDSPGTSLPVFDASKHISQDKIETMGITV